MSQADLPHRRRNLLSGDWVLVSPHRDKRPWQGQVDPVSAPQLASHDPGCHLCPGNARVTGQHNPDYAGPFVFQNDFASLLDETVTEPAPGPFEEAPARGEARVLCYGPDHSQTLATMTDAARRTVIDCWCQQSAELGAKWSHVQLFENKGAMMGASSPHPHGQVWASDFVPDAVAKEDRTQRDWLSRTGTCLLESVAAAELVSGTRLVAHNDHWLAVVPHWAAWPFETLIIARQSVARLEQLDEAGRTALATLLGAVLRAYDGLFDAAFPYSMGWHGAPHGLGEDTGHWRLHAHFYPPLLRSATIRKHMVGFELLAETQRDLTPETAAARLRAAGGAA
jgi:UDPglucose--hexose-1-phosphate uridylyltransferase